jgi:hypothetical protein
VQEPGEINAQAAKHCAANRELLYGMLDQFFR